MMPKSLYRYIWRVSGPDQLKLTLLAVATFLLELAPLELQRRIVNGAIERRELQLLGLLCLLYLGVVLAHGGAKLALNIYRSAVAERSTRELRLRANSAAASRGAEAPSESVQLSVVLSEAEPVGGFVGTSVSDPVLHGGVLLSIFVYMLVLQPLMALVSLVLFAIQAGFVPLMQRAINRRTEKRIRVMREVSAGVVDEASGNGDPSWAERFARCIDQVYGLNMQIWRRKFAMLFLMNFLNQLGIIGVLAVGGWLVLDGKVEIGTIVAFISGLNRVNEPWRDLVTHFREMTNARVKYQLIAKSLAQAGPPPGRAAHAA